MQEELYLKWGGLKGWSDVNEKTLQLLEKFHEYPVSMSAAMQRNTPEQVDILCEIIDSVDGVIINDWLDEEMSKDEAKDYVRNYPG